MRSYAAHRYDLTPTLNDLRLTCSPRGSSGFVVRLHGAITERAGLHSVFRTLSGAVLIDLGGVTKITSFGVREWISALVELWRCQYAFIRVPPSMMAQFNAVSGFGGNGELVSFYAPYQCARCAVESLELVDMRRTSGPIAARDLACPCGGRAELGELPEQYFSYAASRPRVQLPPDLEQLVYTEMGGGVSESLSIRKEVSGQVTALWISGPLTEHASLKRPLENLEGFILADLSGITAATHEGVRRLRDIFHTLEVRHLAFINVRAELVPLFAHISLPFPHVITSVLCRETCKRCKKPAELELTYAHLACGLCGARFEDTTDPQLASLRVVLAPELPPEIADYRRLARAVVREPRPHTVRMSLTPAQLSLDTLIGESAAMRSILETIGKVASSDATVLIRGETGTGKEMIARLLHVRSRRQVKPFIAVNCAALPPSIIESELFGHERGAFTGAESRQLGRFERAHQGTLFIDEIGDIPLEVQVKLLRAVQEHRIERLGGSESVAIDIRLIAATHRPLEEMMRDGSFREDLFYRLNVIPIVVPPLRERREDIWPLARHYLLSIQQRLGKYGIVFGDRARSVLENYSWPGNIRELINVVERAVALTPSNEVAQVGELGVGSAPRPRANSNLKDAVNEYERRLIVEALENSGGNRTRAARELGISRQALGIKLIKYGL